MFGRPELFAAVIGIYNGPIEPVRQSLRRYQAAHPEADVQGALERAADILEERTSRREKLPRALREEFHNIKPYRGPRTLR